MMRPRSGLSIFITALLGLVVTAATTTKPSATTTYKVVGEPRTQTVYTTTTIPHPVVSPFLDLVRNYSLLAQDDVARRDLRFWAPSPAGGSDSEGDGKREEEKGSRSQNMVLADALDVLVNQMASKMLGSTKGTFGKMSHTSFQNLSAALSSATNSLHQLENGKITISLAWMVDPDHDDEQDYQQHHPQYPTYEYDRASGRDQLGPQLADSFFKRRCSTMNAQAMNACYHDQYKEAKEEEARRSREPGDQGAKEAGNDDGAPLMPLLQDALARSLSSLSSLCARLRSWVFGRTRDEEAASEEVDMGPHPAELYMAHGIMSVLADPRWDGMSWCSACHDKEAMFYGLGKRHESWFLTQRTDDYLENWGNALAVIEGTILPLCEAMVATLAQSATAGQSEESEESSCCVQCCRVAEEAKRSEQDEAYEKEAPFAATVHQSWSAIWSAVGLAPSYPPPSSFSPCRGCCKFCAGTDHRRNLQLAHEAAAQLSRVHDVLASRAEVARRVKALSDELDGLDERRRVMGEAMVSEHRCGLVRVRDYTRQRMTGVDDSSYWHDEARWKRDWKEVGRYSRVTDRKTIETTLYVRPLVTMIREVTHRSVLPDNKAEILSQALKQATFDTCRASWRSVAKCYRDLPPFLEFDGWVSWREGRRRLGDGTLTSGLDGGVELVDWDLPGDQDVLW